MSLCANAERRQNDSPPPFLKKYKQALETALPAFAASTPERFHQEIDKGGYRPLSSLHRSSRDQAEKEKGKTGIG